MLCLRLLIFLSITYATKAQTVTADLGQDPVFSTVLKRRLTYPRQAQLMGTYGRIFTEFTINEKGHIQSISVLNHSVERDYAGLASTVTSALRKLPPLSRQYKGSYILPVSFVLVDYRRKNKPFIPTDTLYVQDLAGRIVLNEFIVTGSNINGAERIKAAAKNESY